MSEPNETIRALREAQRIKQRDRRDNSNADSCSCGKWPCEAAAAEE